MKYLCRIKNMIYLMNNLELNNVKRLWASNIELSILRIDPICSIGTCCLSMPTNRHLKFLAKRNVRLAMLGRLSVRTSKHYQSFFLLRSRKNLQVFGSDSETMCVCHLLTCFPQLHIYYVIYL